MYDQENDRPFEYQQNIYQEQMLRPKIVQTQSGTLISKFLALLALLFLFATIGAFIGINIISVTIISMTGYFFLMFVGLIMLLISRFMKKAQSIKLFLLILFIFLEGLALSSIMAAYIADGNILGKSFLIITATFACLACYTGITRHRFSYIKNYLFLILTQLLVTGIVAFFLQSQLFPLALAFLCIVIFCSYAFYYATSARHMNDTLASAIDLAISFFTFM